MTRVLITGGAGYIGSHAALEMAGRGWQAALLDLRAPVFDLKAPWIRGDCTSTTDVGAALDSWRPQVVVHLAGRIEARESVHRPLDYFHHNLGSTVALLEAMADRGMDSLVFASTGSVYDGTGLGAPLDETAPLAPASPYAQSKLMCEQVLAATALAHGFRPVVFRFFNAGGADPKGRAGERHDPETHLIPLVLAAQQSGEALTIMGEDHPTPDGTCIRDYVHVCDIARAIGLAVERLAGGGKGGTYNLGSGRGCSVREVVEACSRLGGRPVPVRIGPRRPGDPARLIADCTRARDELGWRPERSRIDDIVADVLNFLGQ